MALLAGPGSVRCVCVCGRPAQGLVCKAIRPFVSHAALPEVPCTAAVYGLQLASTVLNSSAPHVTPLMSRLTRHAFHVTPHPSHASHVTPHMSRFTRHADPCSLPLQADECCPQDRAAGRHTAPGGCGSDHVLACLPGPVPSALQLQLGLPLRHRISCSTEDRAR